jgi:nucleotide-binding universal stress UspA family protein
MTYKKVVVALDHSQLGQTVYQQALDLAKLHHAELMLFHTMVHTLGETLVPIPMELGLYPELVEDTYQIQQDNRSKHLQQVKTWLHRYADQASGVGILTEIKINYEDQPGPSICETAFDWGADLIVLGRRGFSGIAEALLGSVSNYVLHHAHCAVLVIHNQVEKESEIEEESETFLEKI